jgi:hypothetical protein
VRVHPEATESDAAVVVTESDAAAKEGVAAVVVSLSWCCFIWCPQCNDGMQLLSFRLVKRRHAAIVVSSPQCNGTKAP